MTPGIYTFVITKYGWKYWWSWCSVFDALFSWDSATMGLLPTLLSLEFKLKLLLFFLSLKCSSCRWLCLTAWPTCIHLKPLTNSGDIWAVVLFAFLMTNQFLSTCSISVLTQNLLTKTKLFVFTTFTLSLSQKKLRPVLLHFHSSDPWTSNLLCSNVDLIKAKLYIDMS